MSLKIRVYPESVYPVECWVWAVEPEMGKIPVWRNGGRSKQEAIKRAEETIGEKATEITEEAGR